MCERHHSPYGGEKLESLCQCLLLRINYISLFVNCIHILFIFEIYDVFFVFSCSKQRNVWVVAKIIQMTRIVIDIMFFPWSPPQWSPKGEFHWTSLSFFAQGTKNCVIMLGKKLNRLKVKTHFVLSWFNSTREPLNLRRVFLLEVIKRTNRRDKIFVKAD